MGTGQHEPLVVFQDSAFQCHLPSNTVEIHCRRKLGKLKMVLVEAPAEELTFRYLQRLSRIVETNLTGPVVEHEVIIYIAGGLQRNVALGEEDELCVEGVAERLPQKCVLDTSQLAPPCLYLRDEAGSQWIPQLPLMHCSIGRPLILMDVHREGIRVRLGNPAVPQSVLVDHVLCHEKEGDFFPPGGHVRSQIRFVELTAHLLHDQYVVEHPVESRVKHFRCPFADVSTIHAGIDTLRIQLATPQPARANTEGGKHQPDKKRPEHLQV
mmetsp:Transcript_147015/g.366703  ORF Transcript_147015/g.366703 Transcript_147015/m.366703 type:complete len:268 (+) Transcript_147015:744-1547(+)